MNFIIVMSDSFRFDNLACYSGIRPRFRTPGGPTMTPHLDRFAEKCVIFDRAYCGSYPTVPNRKDLYLGKLVFPFEGWSPLDKQAVTFAKLLNECG